MDTDQPPADEIRRIPTNVRLLPSARTRLDTSAHKHSIPGRRLTRSDVLKACMVVAYRHEAELDKVLAEIGEL
jgi:hypothetical protein